MPRPTDNSFHRVNHHPSYGFENALTPYKKRFSLKTESLLIQCLVDQAFTGRRARACTAHSVCGPEPHRTDIIPPLVSNNICTAVSTRTGAQRPLHLLNNTRQTHAGIYKTYTAVPLCGKIQISRVYLFIKNIEVTLVFLIFLEFMGI